MVSEYWPLLTGMLCFVMACIAAIMAHRCASKKSSESVKEAFSMAKSEPPKTKPKPKAKGGGVKKTKFIFWKMDTCPYCVRFQPVFEELKKEAKRKGMNVEFVADSDTSKAAKKGVTGFPTLQLIQTTTKTHTYSGDRSSESILKWIQGIMGSGA